MPRLLRPRFVFAQLSALVGGRVEGRQSLSLLPNVTDLPGTGWRVIDERTWRTGIAAEAAWAHQARAMKSITAWRSFEQREASRWLWVQITPLASELDAIEAMKAIPERMLANLSSQVTVTSRTELPPPRIDGAAVAWAREERSSGSRGEGVAFYLAWVTMETLSVLTYTGLTSALDWAELILVAEDQSSRIRASGESSAD